MFIAPSPKALFKLKGFAPLVIYCYVIEHYVVIFGPRSLPTITSRFQLSTPSIETNAMQAEMGTCPFHAPRAFRSNNFGQAFA